MIRKVVSAILLFQVSIGAPGVVFAQEATREVSLPGTEVHEFRAANGTLFDLSVALPEGYVADGSLEYPVFYSTDASVSFAGLVQLYRTMTMMPDDELAQLPPMILIGIDRARSSGTPWMVTRNFDLTPTSDPEFDKGMSAWFEATVTTGGADTFLEILEEEVIPWVEARYSTGPERGIGGYSLGGLFATYALLTSPETFTHYWIGSPSFWWDGGAMFEFEEVHAAEADDLDARVFMSVGSLEKMMVPEMLRLAETLKSRGYANLQIETRVLDGASHLSGAFESMSRGLGWLYRPR